MIPASEHPYLYAAFGARAEEFLRRAALVHTLDHDGDFYYLAVPARGPAGFAVQLNVGWQTAYLILGREAVMTFHADSPEAGPALAAELLALVRCFAGAGVRLRFQKAGSTAYAWQVEVRDGDAWTVTHQGRNWLYNYFGTRHEVVLENVEAGAVAPAG